ncbi:hypothetical protein THIOSC13_100004 [uncultured Thiomicrorhabdus sp.]
MQVKNAEKVKKMGQRWLDDIHGVIVEHEGALAYIPADEYEIQMECPDCGKDTLESECDCWTWEYSEGFEDE